MRRKIFGFAAALLLSCSPLASAEDMRFVDAEGFTGYYVDVSSIAFGTGEIPEGTAPEEVAEARVAVVKADRNRRYLYQMRFNRRLETYEIGSSEVQAYDTREVLEKSGVGRMPRHYGFSSPMNGIVNFIYEWKAEQERAAKKSY